MRNGGKDPSHVLRSFIWTLPGGEGRQLLELMMNVLEKIREMLEKSENLLE